MNAPRAAGVRTPWSAMPAAIHAWAEDLRGSPVTDVREQVGGMSPGCATRLVAANGERLFVKAVGAALNPDTPTLFRRESAVLTALGDDPFWARLIDTYDDGDWVALALDDIEGTLPDLTNDATLEWVCEETDRLVGRLATYAISPAVAPGAGPRPAAEPLLNWASAFDHLTELPTDALPAAVVAHAPALQALLRDAAEETSTQLAHFDIRNDNLLVRADGSLVFIDWGMAMVGSSWLDPFVVRLERAELPWFDESVAASPLLQEAGDDLVTALLAGIGTHLVWRTQTAVDIGLPTLQEFRKQESRRFLAGAQRRLT